jgi:hypothetical protein
MDKCLLLGCTKGVQQINPRPFRVSGAPNTYTLACATSRAWLQPLRTQSKLTSTESVGEEGLGPPSQIFADQQWQIVEALTRVWMRLVA